MSHPMEALISSDSKKRRRKTLVVNDIDRYYPPLADWICTTFHFIPNWRKDDGQISLAERNGGIGPHVDNYDVFLIQMSGTRVWQVGREELSVQKERNALIDGLDVRILKNWGLASRDRQDLEEEPCEKMEEWIVHPGDLLYLPPRVGKFHQLLRFTPSFGIRRVDAPQCLMLTVNLT